MTGEMQQRSTKQKFMTWMNHEPRQHVDKTSSMMMQLMSGANVCVLCIRVKGEHYDFEHLL